MANFNKLSKLFTITKNQYPPYLKAILDTITNYHSHATRGLITSQLQIPKCKSEFSKKSFFPSRIKLWNELHGTIRDSVNKLSFKNAVCSSKFKTSSRIYPSNIARSTQVTFTQIRVDFSNLNDALYRKGCTNTQTYDCGHIMEDSKHFFLICTLYNTPRRDMLNEVQMHSQARITPQLLLNGNHCLNEGESMHIITSVCKFIDESKRFG